MIFKIGATVIKMKRFLTQLPVDKKLNVSCVETNDMNKIKGKEEVLNKKALTAFRIS